MKSIDTYHVRIQFQILFWLISCFTLFSQQYHFHTYTEASGLSSSTTYDVKQDSAGQMWFATRAGISVYDGSRWMVYSASAGLQDLSYLKLDIDSSNTVWTLSNLPHLRVAFFSENKWHSVPQPRVEHGKIQRITALKSHADGITKKVTAGTSNYGLFLYENSEWKHFSPDNGLAGWSVRGIVFFKGAFYVATENGISILNFKNNKIDNSINQKISLPDLDLMAIALEPTNLKSTSDWKIWLLGKTWVGYIRNEQFFLFSKKIDFPDYSIYPLIIQPDLFGGLYFGNIYTLYHLAADSKIQTRLTIENGLITLGATSLFIDRERNLWITSHRGVSKLISTRFANYNKTHGLYKNEVTAILESAPGHLVFGHINGLTFYDGVKFKTINFQDEQNFNESDTRVLDLAMDQYQNIWVAVNNLGLAKISLNGDIEWFNDKNGLGKNITSIFIDKNYQIWTCSKMGLQRFDGEKFVELNLGRFNKVFIRKLFPGRNNSIFMATSNLGVLHYEYSKPVKQYAHPHVNMANNVYSILNDSTNRILVGTLDGLYEVQDGLLTKFRRKNFEINRPVYLIIKDRKGRLWFGTDNGVIRWDGDNHREFTVRDGFAGQETNRSAGLVDYLGHVWIGSDLGVSCYREEFDIEPEMIAPPIVELASVEINGEKRSAYHNMKLNYTENNLIFNFNCISFVDENHIMVRTKLEGFDNQWRVEKLTAPFQARYNNLPSGNYQFKIQGQNAVGSWSPVKSSGAIIIQLPFWKTWWFYIISFFLTSLIILSSYRIVAERKYAAMLEIKVQERTAQLKASETRLRKQNQVLMELANLETFESQNLYEVLKKFTETAATTLDVSWVGLWLYNSDRTKIQCVDLYDFEKNQHLPGDELEIQKYSNYFKALSEERTLAIHDVYHDARFQELVGYFLNTKREIASTLDAPIRHAGKIIGIICSENQGEKRYWTIDEQNFAGSLADLISVALAIQEQKRAEKALAEERNLLRTVIDLIPDEIYAKDLQSRFVVTNKAVTEIWGFNKSEEIIGKSDFDIFAPELAQKYYDEEQQLIRNSQSIMHKIIQTPDGGWFSSSKIPWLDKDGNIMGLVGINRDIYEQKRAEAAIQANEEKFRSIFEKSPVGIEIYDSKGKLIDANPASLEIFGCHELKDIQGLDLFENPNFSDAIKDDLRQGKIVKREVVYDFEKVKNLKRFSTQKSGTIYLDILMTPFNSANHDEATGFLIILKDITEHKTMEAELSKASKLESLGILAAGIAHDFNNILTAIIGNIHLIKMNIAHDGESFEILNEAEMAAGRASELTQQLLTFSKGGLPIKKTASIAELIHDTIRFVFRGSNVRCEFHIPQDLWLAPIDVGQISQVVNNLAINALQAMPDGGRVVVRAENVQLPPDTPLPLAPGNYVKVVLQDQGIGIPGHVLPKVFDPYFTTKPKGSGLGLAISYSIIKKHKGHILIESEAGFGTLVQFYLPAIPDAVLSIESTTSQKIMGDGRILVMDDELIVRQVLGKLLTRFGYQVDFAKEGNEAIQLYQKAKNENRPYLLVIMDLTIPGGMGGKETIKELLMVDPTVRAIVSSGYFNDPIMANYQNYGFKGFISKPYKMKELQNIIFNITHGIDSESKEKN